MASLWDKIKQVNTPAGMTPEELLKVNELMAPYKKRLGATIVFTMTALIVGIFALVLAEPMRAWETIPMLMLLTAPLTYFLARRTLQFVFDALPPADTDQSHAPTILIQRGAGLGGLGEWHKSIKQRMRDPRMATNLTGLIIMVSAGSMSLAVSALLAVNCFADTSAPHIMTIPIESKYISHGKHGSRYYKLRFPSPARPLLPFAFDDYEITQTSSSNFSRVIPGQTAITIEVHPGMLGLPWYHPGNPALQGLSDTTEPTPRAQKEPSQAILAEACAWRDGFNLARDHLP